MNYISLNSEALNAYNPQFGSGYTIETSISDGGVIGVDTRRPKHCAECIYCGRAVCPATMASGKCGVRA